jgi:hypothetical protein
VPEAGKREGIGHVQEYEGKTFVGFLFEIPVGIYEALAGAANVVGAL